MTYEQIPEDRLYDEKRDGALLAEAHGASADVLEEPGALGNDHGVLDGPTASTDSDALTDRDVLADAGTTDPGAHTDGTTDTTGTDADHRETWVRPELAMDLRTRWDVIQRSFVDDPRNAVSDADSLVDEVMQRLSDTFNEQLRKLESEWHEGEPSTEDLRTALKRYRTFFHRLLEV